MTNIDPKNVTVERTDTAKIVLPANMTYDKAIMWLQRRKEADEKYVQVQEVLDAFPFDAAHALKQVIDERFGFSDSSSPTWYKLPIDAQGNTLDVFLGDFEIPDIDGSLSTVPDWTQNKLIVSAYIRQKDKSKVDTLLALIRKYLREHSLYQGRAIRVAVTKRGVPATPEFIALNGEVEVLLNSDTQYLLDATLYSQVTHYDDVRRFGLPRTRGVLLSGPYGTGKTLTALKLAQLCERYGQTFIYSTEPEGLIPCYRLAQRYAPAFVFAEDVDRLVESDPTALTSVLDGLDTKASEVTLVLTTNHIDRLPPALLRHGRLDAVVFFGPPDAETAAKLVAVYGGSHLSSAFDFVLVGETLAGETPSTIREAVERAKRYTISRMSEGSRKLVIDTDDVLRSIDGMRPHLRYINRPPAEELSESEKAAERFGLALRGELAVMATNGHS